MPLTRKYAIYATAFAGILFIVGLFAAQAVWPDFSPMQQTMSSLAAKDAPTRWLMTFIIVVVGICQIVAAHGFKQAATPGRWVLGISGVGAFGVAAFPVPHIHADSNWHTFMAGVVLVGMCLWPVFSITRKRAMPWVLSHRGAWTSTVCLAVLGLCFLATWLTDSYVMGFLERTLIASQIIWLLITLRISHKSGLAMSNAQAPDDLLVTEHVKQDAVHSYQ